MLRIAWEQRQSHLQGEVQETQPAVREHGTEASQGVFDPLRQPCRLLGCSLTLFINVMQRSRVTEHALIVLVKFRWVRGTLVKLVSEQELCCVGAVEPYGFWSAGCATRM